MTSANYIRAYHLPESINLQEINWDYNDITIASTTGGILAGVVGMGIETLFPSAKGLSIILLVSAIFLTVITTVSMETKSRSVVREANERYAQHIKRFQPYQIVPTGDYNTLLIQLTDEQREKVLSYRLPVCPTANYQACKREEAHFWTAFYHREGFFENFNERYKNYRKQFPEDSKTIQIFLETQLTIENFQKMSQIANQCKMEHLERFCKNFYNKNSKEINYSHLSKQRL